MTAKGLDSIFLGVLFGFLFPFCSYSQGPSAHLPDDDWKISTPEAQGIDSRKLLEMFQDIKAKGDSDFHSILIVKNGYLILECYLPPYHKETLHNVKSASKSVLSALVGIALEKEYLRSLDQKVSEFYPEYTNDPQKKEITLRQLLTMTAGFDWSYDQETTNPASPTELESWKVVPMRDAPGEKFQYNTMLVHMMSTVLTKASGTSTKEFAMLSCSTFWGFPRSNGVKIATESTLAVQSFFKTKGYGQVWPSLPQQRSVEGTTSRPQSMGRRIYLSQIKH